MRKSILSLLLGRECRIITPEEEKIKVIAGAVTGVVPHNLVEISNYRDIDIVLYDFDQEVACKFIDEIGTINIRTINCELAGVEYYPYQLIYGRARYLDLRFDMRVIVDYKRGIVVRKDIKKKGKWYTYSGPLPHVSGDGKICFGGLSEWIISEVWRMNRIALQYFKDAIFHSVFTHPYISYAELKNRVEDLSNEASDINEELKILYSNILSSVDTLIIKKIAEAI